MPIRPVRTVLATEQEIAAICEKAREQIFAKVLDHYNRHPGSAWSGHYLVDLEKTVKALYKQMGVDIGGAFRDGLPKTMREFYDRAAKDMVKMGRRNAMLGAPDTDRVNYFLNSSFEQVAMRTTKMSFDHIRQLRSVSAEVLRTASLTGQTRAQVTRELLARASEIPGFKFTDNGGREWKDEAYFRMLARTELMNAGRAAYDDKCAAEGCDVMMLDYSGNCCEACAKWEGQLFSLTGATPGLPTKADLEAEGVFHPNCTHSYSAVPDYVRENDFNPDGSPKQQEPEEAKPEPEAKPAPEPKPQASQTAAAAPHVETAEEHRQRRQEQLERAKEARLQRECALVGPECKPIKGKHTVQQDLAAVNPHLGENGTAYSYNCQRCVTTYEARRRGLDVTALPTYKGDTWPNGVNYADAYVDGKKHIIDCSAARGNGARANVEKQVLAAPDGARFIVDICFKGNTSDGHVFIAENQGGVVKWIDPQLHGRDQQMDATTHWNLASGKNCACLRVDNLKFSAKLNEVCKEAEK